MTLADVPNLLKVLAAVIPFIDKISTGGNAEVRGLPRIPSLVFYSAGPVLVAIVALIWIQTSATAEQMNTTFVSWHRFAVSQGHALAVVRALGLTICSCAFWKVLGLQLTIADVLAVAALNIVGWAVIAPTQWEHRDLTADLLSWIAAAAPLWRLRNARLPALATQAAVASLWLLGTSVANPALATTSGWYVSVVVRSIGLVMSAAMSIAFTRIVVAMRPGNS